jgi:hypothetical protein
MNPARSHQFIQMLSGRWPLESWLNLPTTVAATKTSTRPWTVSLTKCSLTPYDVRNATA